MVWALEVGWRITCKPQVTENKLQAPCSMLHAKGAGRFWSLGFGASLDLGSWILELRRAFSFCPFRKRDHRVHVIVELIGVSILLPAPAATALPNAVVGAAIVVDGVNCVIKSLKSQAFVFVR